MCFSQYTTIDELIPCGLKSFPTVVGNPCTLPSHGVCSDQCVSHADCNKGLDFDAPDAEREYCGEQCIYIYIFVIHLYPTLTPPNHITIHYTKPSWLYTATKDLCHALDDDGLCINKTAVSVCAKLELCVQRKNAVDCKCPYNYETESG